MVYRPVFALGLAFRMGSVVLAFAAMTGAVMLRPPGALWLVMAGLSLIALVALWQHIDSTNRELARFIEAIHFGDLTSTFKAQHGGGFEHLADAMNAGIQRLRAERQSLNDANGFFGAVIDNVPVAILSVDEAGKVALLNRSSRRLFAEAKGVQPGDFASFGGAFVAGLTGAKPPERQVVQLTLPGGSQRAMVHITEVRRLAGSIRLIAVQPIQDALNAVELAAQSDLVRVLTHEIMNSITPITSLAQSVAELMVEVDRGNDPLIGDARLAAETLARRADGVMNFVQSYRQISRPPTIRRQRVMAQTFAEQISALFQSDWAADRAELRCRVEPHDLSLNADPDLLAQVVINLMRNSAEACEEAGLPIAIALTIARASSGSVIVTVADRGPGIPEAMQKDVFLPFFTTKPKGTGVGLSFARQVVHAHDGLIEVLSPEGGGTEIVIRI